MKPRRSLVREVLHRGLLSSAVDVEVALAENRVRVNGAVVSNAASLVAPGDTLHVAPMANRFVGRGGIKLEGALQHFGIDVAHKFCLDVGASTGGFTDCLLQHGASHVVAVDVGRGQLHQKMLTHAAVTSLESQHISQLSPEGLRSHWGPGHHGLAQIVVTDVSFTSLAQLVPHIVSLSGNGAELVLLVKPQFEADRNDVPVGGIVVDPQVRQGAVDRVAEAVNAAGCHVHGQYESPISGAGGNIEFFLWATVHTDE
ncbi:MAG: TlyA family RNA methyltransferase [Actinobacteria bacterium]|nr:TlyA family RNA methyltransferase [Actinomycetota bacterium]